MSVSKRVAEALERSSAKAFAAALFAASAAVESTVNREFPAFKSRPRRFTTFLVANAEIVGRVGFGGALPRRVAVAGHPTLKPDARGSVATEDVLFETIRCSVVYEARMADFISFGAEPSLTFDGQRFRVPERLPLALAVAVLLSPVNRKEWMEEHFEIVLNRRPVSANELWGKRELIGPLLASGAI